ncbi:cytochrome P450 [Colletotrichum graminicola M1.001]|uniref:Cytochrome P450 n=1 Tax=Colletotrichum graminicola (strain M1.001 / M2 / FGSC 10212) TaxID=645133 RepID=E3QZS7_COLGM|nr:cytochrome P450 [Colletotrichum graminicola M1.001]EFQ36365.1 cytochrome P450 [Colletotrichum graminicola M1.001]
MSAATALSPESIWLGSRQLFTPTTVLAVILLCYVFYIIYDVKFGPLSSIPGPFWYKASGIPLAYVQGRGKEAEVIPILHERYGPVVQIAPREVSFNSGADAWQDMYGFVKPGGDPKPAKDPIMYIDNVIDYESIHVASDVNHARQRRLLAPAFGDAALRTMQPVLTMYATKMKDKITERIGSQAGAARIDLMKMFLLTAFDILGSLTFGESLNMLEDGEFTPWAQTVLDSIRLDAWIRIARHFAIGRVLVNALMNTKTARAKHWEHFEYSKKRVDKRLARSPTHPDFWSFVEKKSEAEDGLSMGEQYVNATVIMLAGTETTATALSGVIFFLTKNPEILKTVREEVQSTFGSIEDMTLDKLARAKYLNACITETLRIYPPAPTALLRRTPPQGATICGVQIPGDVTVGGHIYSTHTSPMHFKNPLEFHPERWLGDAEYADDHLDAWAPFSVGPHNCVGKNLLFHEVRLLLATMLKYFDFTLAHESQDWSRQRVFTLWEKLPLLCDVKPALPVASAS